jgi:3-deoxy-manno-octulosonate cytidylyltransferase (CMP-KDO synthetase)
MHDIDFRVVIPARYASTRLPGKPLLPIAGRPMLQHVYERALQSGASAVVIATDDERIRDAAARFDATVCMTAPEHASGTERLGEVVARLGWGDDTLVVNVQGDEPLIAPALIRQVATGLAANADAAVATLAWWLDDAADMQDPNIVKVVLDKAGYALYFSRAPIPFARDADPGAAVAGLRHIGLYAYRAGFLASYAQLHVSIAVEMPGPGVDTPADLQRVERLLATTD